MLSNTRRDYHIKHLLGRCELAILYGESTAGKTFVALDFAAHIATGKPWRNHRVKQGRVVYVCTEGLAGFASRLEALRRQHGVDDFENLRIITDTPSLLNAIDHKAIAEQIETWGGCDLLVVDTLSRVIAGGDENSAEVMTQAIKRCGELHKRTGASVLLVAHSGKDASKGVRGHSSVKPARRQLS